MSIFEYDKEEEERKLRKAEYEAGLKEGELQKAKETAIALKRAAFPVEKIAEVLQVPKDTVQKWLAEFFQKNKSEVIAMSIFEYDKEEEERKLRKAEYEAGKKEGINEIAQNMFCAGESVEKIAQYTGCEVQELEKILKEVHS